MGVAAANQIVKHDGQQRQHQRVEQHRRQHKVIAFAVHPGAAEDRRQGHRAAGRMQAAQKIHPGDGQRRRQPAGQRRVGHQHTHRDADQRRQHIAADNRPRLRQRTARHAKQEYRRGAHGSNKPQVNFAQQPVAEHAGHRQAGAGADGSQHNMPSSHRQRMRLQPPKENPQP